MNPKMIIFAVAALVAGLGAGTGAVILRAPKHPAADSLHADSLAVLPQEAAHIALHEALGPASDSALAAADHVETIMASSEGASGARATAAAPGAAAMPPPTPGAGSPKSTASAAGKPAAEDKATHVVSAALTPRPAPSMTPIFLSMKPAEAARILALLSDDQAADVLRGLEPRQAAGILCQLPPERAAGVSRRLLLGHAMDGR